MNEFKISREIYSKIILAISDKKLKQKDVAKALNIKPQTFSDNLNKLKSGKFISLTTLLELQTFLETDLGINFFN